MDARELTRDEKKKIRTLVTGMCANYDRESGLCLPLDCACYMLHKCWTGAYCRYFREAVLPLNPELQASLTTEGTNHWFYLYTDEGSSFITVRDNWTEADKFLKNANGPGNVWENNGPTVNDSIKVKAGVASID